MQVESGVAVRASQVLGVILPRLFNMEILPPKTALVDGYFHKLSPIVTPPPPKKKKNKQTNNNNKMKNEKKKKRKNRKEKPRHSNNKKCKQHY